MTPRDDAAPRGDGRLSSKSVVRTATMWLRRQPPATRIAAGLAVAASLYAWLVFLANFFRPDVFGLPDFRGIGADWMVFHAVAQNYLTGHMADIHDGFRLTVYVNQHYAHWLHGLLSYRAWIYPPSFLLVIAPFGYFGFVPSYVLFETATAACLAAAVMASSEARAARFVLIGTFLSPSAAMNLVCGQNAFLFAAVIIGGIALLKERPIVAGAILGLVSLKPQLALLIPVALVAAGSWRAFVAAAVSALLLVALSAAIFGPDAWLVWIRDILTDLFTDGKILDHGRLLGAGHEWVSWGRLWGISVWACAVLLGATQQIASRLQDVAAIFAAGAVFLTFRRSSAIRTQLAVLLPATILAAPYAALYDAVLLAPAVLLWLSERQRYREPAALVMAFALWIIPNLCPPAAVPPGRLTPLFLVAFILFAVARMWRDEAPADHTGRPSLRVALP